MFVLPFVLTGSVILPHVMSVPALVSVDWLDNNKNSVTLLDATYEVQPKRNHKEFKEKHYARFKELMLEKANYTQNYSTEHIPGAVLFDVGVAYYPSQYIRYDLYPPKEFEKYVKLLGVNNGDHVVVYSRGPGTGMLWAARVWWTFKVYGHNKVSVLNGGLGAWKNASKPVTSDVVVVASGNWMAKPIDKSLLITFEELDQKNSDGKSLFQDLTKINYLDARPAGVFNGTEPLGIPAEGATGAHLKGAKNVPLAKVVGEHGMKSKEEIEETLKNAGYDGSLLTVAACNGGVQASLLALALDHAGKKYRVYNGSMFEIGYLICGDDTGETANLQTPRRCACAHPSKSPQVKVGNTTWNSFSMLSDTIKTQGHTSSILNDVQVHVNDKTFAASN
ncbi:hypothetical protein RB195_001615 [Necator americanus]|uniref:Rhodanese domain-containing protein n=1 Tax=Necator americanus TaxID=51031 RepID=A0ABR1DF60_NECAM